jgi:hypothetical protein
MIDKIELKLGIYSLVKVKYVSIFCYLKNI